MNIGGKLRAKATDLETPAKRAKRFRVGNRHAVWVSIGGSRGGLSLGYRPRGKRPGTWNVKLVDRGVRKEHLLGVADDAAAGTAGMAYTAALNAALTWAAAQRMEINRSEKMAGRAAPHTVRDAVEAYLRFREAKSLRWGRDARSRLTRHVLSNAALAALPLNRLGAAHLTTWRSSLCRLQPASVNRLLNDLRACLTAAMPSQVLPSSLRAALRGTPGANQARQAQVLSQAEVRAVVLAADEVDPTFGQLVLLMAATGARFSQLVRINVGDVQLAQRRVLVPASNKGNGTAPKQHIAVPVGDDVLERLGPIVRGRPAHAPLLVRRDGNAWATASEMTVRWQRASARAGLPAGISPYALRSSSIVRMLAAHVPVRFVAQLHDTSVSMIERHYNRHVTGEVETAAREVIVPLTSAAVIPLPQVARVV
jgi:integrase